MNGFFQGRKQGLIAVVALMSVSCGKPESPPEAPLEPGTVAEAPSPSRSDMLIKVTKTFGPLVVKPGRFEATSKVKPWSAYWLPTKDTYLFEGRNGVPAPLEKYDTYVRKVKKQDSRAAEFERKELYDGGAESWEGVCNGWAIASIIEAEPTRELKLPEADGISFGVGDQKALLIKSYEKVDQGLEQFGQRYNGDRESVWDDIYPDQLHRLIQVQLFQNGLPFIIDKEPGIQVWNIPIWRVSMKIDADVTDSHVLHVDMMLEGASPFVPHDFKGTEVLSFPYTYDLYGTPQADGTFKAQYGMWTKASVDYHPDFAIVVSDHRSHYSRNKYLKQDVVQEILARAAKQP